MFEEPFQMSAVLRGGRQGAPMGNFHVLLQLQRFKAMRSNFLPRGARDLTGVHFNLLNH